MDFKNTADDLIDYEIKIDNITGASNRAVTTSRAPKKILSKVTQQMVDDYKRSLIQPYVDATTGDKFLYKPVVPVALNDVKRMEADLRAKEAKNIDVLKFEQQTLINDYKKLEEEQQLLNNYFLIKKINEPVTLDEYKLNIQDNKSAIVLDSLQLINVNKFLSDGKLDLESKQKEIEAKEIEIKTNKNEIVVNLSDIKATENEITTKEEEIKLHTGTEKKLNKLKKTLLYYIDNLKILEDNKIILQNNNTLLIVELDSLKTEETLMLVSLDKADDRKKQIEYAIDKRKKHGSLFDSELAEIYGTDSKTISVNNKRQNVIKTEMKKILAALENKMADIDNEKLTLASDIKDLQIAKEENKQKIQEYNINFRELNQNVNNIPVQEPGEQEEDFLNRLEQFSGQKYNDKDISDSLEYKLYINLKDKFNSLFNMGDQRKLSIVESFLNTIDIEEKNSLYSKWTLFEKKFLELYGFNNSNIKTNNIIDFWNDFQLVGLIPSTATPTTTPNYGNLNEYKYINDSGPALLYYTFISGDKRNEKKYVVAISRDGIIGTFKTFSVTGKTLIEIYNSLVDFSFSDGTQFEDEVDDDKQYDDLLNDLSETILKKYSKPNKKILQPPELADQKSGIKEKYITRNPETNEIIGAGTKKKKIIGRGISLPDVPDIISFGKVNLLYKKLINNNVLSIKDKKNKSIANCKNVTVSDYFVNIVSKIIDNVDITNDYHELSEDEKILYNSLMLLSGLSKVAKVPKPSIQFFKNKVQLLSGEIESGNDNIKVKEDLKYYLNQLVLFKAITKKQASIYFNEVIN